MATRPRAAMLLVLLLTACGDDPSPVRATDASTDAVAVLDVGGDVVAADRGATPVDAPPPDQPAIDGGVIDDRGALDAPAADVPAATSDVPAMTSDVPAATSDVPAMTVDVPAVADAGSLPRVTGVPRIDAALKATLRAMYLRGVAAGLRAGVFAKAGDSITESASFLASFGPASGTPSYNLGAYTALDPARVFFNATLVDASHSSFDRATLAAQAGWTTARALDDDATLLRQELTTLRPAAAVVMFGSADIEATELAVFRANLTRIVQIIAAANVIPVLSTVPDRTDTPTSIMVGPSFNAVIREVAAAQSAPLEDYRAALQPLPMRGLSEDGVHPSIYRSPTTGTESAYFTTEALAYGYNMRNLVTLATLAHLRAVVYDDGPPDA